MDRPQVEERMDYLLTSLELHLRRGDHPAEAWRQTLAAYGDIYAPKRGVSSCALVLVEKETMEDGIAWTVGEEGRKEGRCPCPKERWCFANMTRDAVHPRMDCRHYDGFEWRNDELRVVCRAPRENRLEG